MVEFKKIFLKSVARAGAHWKASLFNHPPRLTAAWVLSLAENFHLFYLQSATESYCT